VNDAPVELLHVSAPVRLDFAGAWSDVAPFADEARGVVINAAIDLRTHVELRPGGGCYRLRSDDLDLEMEADSIEGLSGSDRLNLLSAAVRRYRPAPCSLRTWAEAPPGSGLGTSGALTVALVHAMTTAAGLSKTAIDVAADAWQLETVDAAVAGGQQDQYAAALGGFQQLVFDHGTTRVMPLALDPAFVDELAAHVIICYSGRSRFSADTITRVMQAYRTRVPGVVSALHALADLGQAMGEALRAADLARVAELLNQNWREQLRLDPAMCTDGMAQIDSVVRAAGAIGGKAAGAGTGGSMFYVVPGDTAPAIAAVQALGVTVLPTRWADRGVTVD
jgi:D-glycero-alpha-D-manno-heptose-7-phosphate kinase